MVSRKPLYFLGFIIVSALSVRIGHSVVAAEGNESEEEAAEEENAGEENDANSALEENPAEGNEQAEQIPSDEGTAQAPAVGEENADAGHAPQQNAAAEAQGETAVPAQKEAKDDEKVADQPQKAGETAVPLGPQDEKEAEAGQGPARVEERGDKTRWKSYNDGDGGDVAKDVTSGIRVEDIVEPPVDYRYAAFGRTDPFVPPELSETKGGNDEVPVVSPLQEYPLNQLQLIGIWRMDSGEHKGLVMTPTGEGVVVKNGDPIGLKRGRIVEIQETLLKVREYVLAPDGTRQFEDLSLRLSNGDTPPKDNKMAAGEADIPLMQRGGNAPQLPTAGVLGVAQAPMLNPPNPVQEDAAMRAATKAIQQTITDKADALQKMPALPGPPGGNAGGKAGGGPGAAPTPGRGTMRDGVMHY